MKKFNTSKKLLTAAVVAAGLFFAVSSCKKSSSGTTSVTLTETQAAELITDAITPTTGGMVTQVSSSATFYASSATTNSVNHLRTYSNVTCGVIKDTTIKYVSTAGSVPSFSYSLSWQNSLACTVPTTFTCAFQGTGNYTGPFLTSQFNSAGTFNLANLNAADTSYTFNSNFQRQGTTSTRQGTQVTFNHSIRISSTNIIYGKASQEIISGTATVAVIVTNSSGKSWDFNGTLTFLGHKTASLVLNSGTVYQISWS